MYYNSKTLRYTRNTIRLTWEERLFYEKNGYLTMKNLVPMDILNECNRRFDDIAMNRIPKESMIVVRDVVDRKSVNKIQDINHDSVFKRYIEHKNLLDVVEAMTGPNIMSVHSMLIAKPPDIGAGTSRHPPHQDLHYFPFRPANWIVASWTAMENCTRENGCLFVSPGSHLANKLYPHDYPSEKMNKFYHGIQKLPDSLIWLDMEMRPGDTIFFHPLLVHGSGINSSSGTRKAISCHYAAAECEYIEIVNTSQEKIGNEVLDLVRKRYPGINVEYKDVWKFKSSLVKGIRSRL